LGRTCRASQLTGGDAVVGADGNWQPACSRTVSSTSHSSSTKREAVIISECRISPSLMPATCRSLTYGYSLIALCYRKRSRGHGVRSHAKFPGRNLDLNSGRWMHRARTGLGCAGANSGNPEMGAHSNTENRCVVPTPWSMDSNAMTWRPSRSPRPAPHGSRMSARPSSEGGG
jgi:hypothetical protein